MFTLLHWYLTLFFWRSLLNLESAFRFLHALATWEHKYLRYTNGSFWPPRQIWSCVRINTCTHLCSSVLYLLCLCWWVEISSLMFVVLFSIIMIGASHICVIVINCVGNLPTGSAGLGFLQFCNLNSFRTKFILGFSVFMGLSVPQYFNEYTSVAGYGPVHTHSRWVCNSTTFLHILAVIWRGTNHCLV